ncbi:MAG: GTP 3',8-cyclase MoaA [Nitrospirae bacterium]|nr:GTP 3',8-cyclase MoaA [Nitrospirota bacterium]
MLHNGACTDRYGRIIDYMRISVIDRCNLRCIYCMPSEGVKLIEHGDILSYEDIIRIVRIAAGLGVKKIRITGGEPLVRKDLDYLIASLNNIEGIEDISLTTNGILLKKYAKALSSAGLRRVNVSMDSLRPDRFRDITRGGDISEVWDGMNEAERLGLVPIKINMVPIKGINDDEIEDFARLTIKTPYHVRFIEFMPIGARDIWSREKYMSTDEIKERVSAIAPLEPVKLRKSGPARYFRFEGSSGVIGFISPITHHFCNSCNRLRMTPDGKIRPCLFSETEIDIKSAIRQGASDDELEKLLLLSMELKPEGHSINEQESFSHLRPMSRIGG